MAEINPLNLSITKLMTSDVWSAFRVRFGLDGIFVTVTHDPSAVCYWISKVRYLNFNIPPEHVMVAVRMERKIHRTRLRLNNGVDIIQLCVRKECLIYQVSHSNGNIPKELLDFLGDRRYTFVGSKILNVSEILSRVHQIHLGGKLVDLSDLAAKKHQDMSRVYGITELSNIVLQRHYRRPNLLDSDWDSLVLEPDLIMYACADAVVCFRAGFALSAWTEVLPRNQDVPEDI